MTKMEPDGMIVLPDRLANADKSGFVDHIPDRVITAWRAYRNALSEPHANDNTISIMDIVGVSDGLTASKISDKLKALDGQTVTVEINSPGGILFEGVAIYNLLKSYRGEVKVRIFGVAASVASIIAMAGNRVEIAASAFIMIHNSWSLALGDKTAMEKAARDLALFDKAMAEIYALRSEARLADIKQWMNESMFITAKRAVDLGFADTTFNDGVRQADDKTKPDALAANANASMDDGEILQQFRAFVDRMRGLQAPAPESWSGINSLITTLKTLT